MNRFPADQSDSAQLDDNQKQTESRVRQYASIFENMPIGLYVFHLEDPHDDRTLRIVSANPEALKSSGVTMEEVVGSLLDESFPDLREKGIPQKYAQVVRSGHPMDIDLLYYGDDGLIETAYSVKAFPLSDDHLGVAFELVTDRKQAEYDLNRSHSLVTAALESTTDGILVVDSNGRVVSYNRKFLEMWGIPEALAEQQDDQVLLDAVMSQLKDPPAFIEKVQSLYKSPNSTSFDELEFSDGRVMERYSQPQLLDGQVIGRVWSFRDVTASRQAVLLQQAVYQISDAANNSTSLDELFRSVHAIIGRAMPARNFYIALYDAERDLLEFPYYVDEVEGTSSIPASRLGRGMTEYVLRTSKALLSDQSNFDALVRAGEVELIGAPSPIWVGAPLVVDGRTIGVIGMQDYHDSGVYTERELHMLEFVSEQVAKAIERTRLVDDIQRNNRLLSALQEATVPIIKQNELSEVLQEILRQVASLFETTDGYIYLVKPDDREIILSLGIGPSTGYIGSRLKMGEGLAGKVWEDGVPLIVDDYSAWSGRSEIFKGLRVYATAAVPLISRSKIIGVLGIGHITPDQIFDREDLELLTRFSELASIAIENARLYTMAQQELAERKTAEEALREAEIKYRTVVEQISAITYTAAMDEDKTRLYVSPQIETLLGYSQEEYLTDSHLWKKMLHRDDRERVLAEWEEFYRTEAPFISDYRTVAKDGRVVWFHSEAVIYQDQADHKRFIQGIMVDISPRKEAEALQAAIYRISAAANAASSMDELYRAIHESLQEVMIADNFFIALYDKETDQLQFPYHVDENDSVPATASLGRGPTAYVIRNGVPLLGRSETMQALEEQGVIESAGTRSIDWLGVPLKIKGETVGVMAVQTYTTGVRYSARELDILNFVSAQVASSIEHKRSEEALQASEARYRLSARATNDVIWEWDILNDHEVWSDNLQSLFGYSKEDTGLDPSWWGKHVHPQDYEKVIPNLREIMDGSGTIWGAEYRFIRKDGSTAYVIDRGYIERSPDGKPLKMIGAMTDITERKQREEELSALASVSAALRVAGSRDEILRIIVDQAMSLLFGSGAFLALLRSDTDELVVEEARGEWADLEGVRAPAVDSVSDQLLFSAEGETLATDSFISAPLSTPNGTIGTLNIGRPTSFTAGDVRLLTNIADVAANAIQRASALEQIKRQIERLNALRTIDMFIAGGTDLRLTLQTILKQAVSQLEVDAADILLLHPSIHTLEYLEGIGFRTRGIEQTSLRMGEGLAGRVALTRETISLSLDDDPDAFVRRTMLVGDGFVFYCGVPLIAKGEVKGVLEIFHRSHRNIDREWMNFLESLAGQTALAMDNASLFESLQHSNLELSLAYETTLEGWSAALDLRDKETEGHTQRVTSLTLKLAEAMALSEKEQMHMRRGALLHDIGKMGVPDRILLKPNQLTDEEWEIMRQHPVYAHTMLQSIVHLRPALDIPLYHHEKWDGTGYPRGLKGEAIPLAARIFAVADVWDALCSDRPYRKAWSKEKALAYIKSLSGIHFDPTVVNVFLRLVGEE